MSQIKTTQQNKQTWRLPLFPSARLLWLVLGVSIVCTILSSVVFRSAVPWFALLAVAVLLLIDLWLGLRLPTPTVKRDVADNWSLAVATQVALRIRHTPRRANSRRALRVAVHDWHPERCIAPHAQQNLTLTPNTDTQITYQATAHQRGLMTFVGVEFHIDSPLRFWQVRRFVSSVSNVRILPNFTRIAHYRLLATANRLSDLGVLKQPRRGSGLEFHQLREFRQGDSLRQIHWQATAAQRRLISKEYEDERNQQILFMLDASRRMIHKDSHESLLDEALNSALLLSHVALNQGDAVGMLSMGQTTRWHSPKTGMTVVAQLMNQFYDIQPEPVAADYLAAAETLLARQKKRSLIVVITNTRNEDFGDLYMALRLLRKKHLVVLADIREKLLKTLVNQPIDTIDTAVHFHAAHQYLEHRWKQHSQLRHHGILVLDVEADQLPPALISQYLQLKESAQI